MRALLFVSHGSYSKKAYTEVRVLVKQIKKESKISVFHYAFLEINHPNISKGLERCVIDGARHIVILLNFLNTGHHARFDIPRIVKKALIKFPYISFQILPPIGQDPAMKRIYLSAIRKSFRNK